MAGMPQRPARRLEMSMVLRTCGSLYSSLPNIGPWRSRQKPAGALTASPATPPQVFFTPAEKTVHEVQLAVQLQFELLAGQTASAKCLRSAPNVCVLTLERRDVLGRTATFCRCTPLPSGVKVLLEGGLTRPACGPTPLRFDQSFKTVFVHQLQGGLPIVR